MIKIWIATALVFLLATYNFLTAESLIAFDAAQYFLGAIGVVVGAYFVAQKQKKIGIFLWLAGFILLKVSMMVF